MQKIFTIVGVMISTFTFGEIKEIHSLDEIKTLITSPSSANEWVIFDIDYTLTAPTHPALQMPAIKQNKQRFKEEFAKFTKEEQVLIPALIATKEPRKLIHQDIPSLIKELQNSGATVFGFTAIDTSIAPEVGDIPNWRTNELKNLDISFIPSNDSPLPKKRVAFTQFPPFRGTYPVFQDGVLYSNVKPSKGEVLNAFIDIAEEKPVRIIFIDDSLENVESVEKEMAKRGIDVIGLHYIEPQGDHSLNISDKDWKDFWDEIPNRLEKFSNPSHENNHLGILIMPFQPLNSSQPTQIITLDNPQAKILGQKTLDIQANEFAEAEEIAKQLFSSLHPLMPAAGLAAPQIGIDRSIFIYTYDRKPENLEAAINPSYIPVGDETIEGYDACFSSPLKIAKLKRYKTILATYLNVKGEKVEKILDGFGAKVFQHEYDHLQGIVNINRPDAEVRSFYNKEEQDAFMDAVKKEDATRYKPPESI